MAALVLATHWLLGRVLTWPDLPLLAAEVAVGAVTYGVLTRGAFQQLLARRSETRG
jgi:hypothetical protein